MNLDSRSKNCADVTDQYTELTPEMTDKFLRIFYSGSKVTVTIYLMPDSIWQWKSGEEFLLSPKMYNMYEKWKETIPTLLKELV
jgi:hypothetical protein